MKLFLSIVISFFAIRGFRYELTGDGLVMRNTLSFTWLLLFLFFIAVLNSSLKESDKKLKSYCVLFSLILSVFYLLGVNLEKTGTLSRIWENTGYLSNQLNLLFSHAVLYYCFSFLAVRFLAKNQDHGSTQKKTAFTFRTVLLFWGILLVFYLPWYLANYPGVISPDSDDQIRQALHTNPLNNHHPVLLTLVIRGILAVTRIFTPSVQTGIGVCSFLQMLTVTFVFAAAYVRIRCYLSNRILRLLAFLWYAVYPVNTIFSITLWKDILFSVGILVLMLCLDNAAENEADYFSRPGKQLILFFTLVLLPIIRHNGILITLILSVYLLFAFRSSCRKILLICGGALFLVGIWDMIILPALHAKSVEPDLMLSVPQQQIARSVSLHMDEISDEQIEKLGVYYDIPDIWTRYNPRLSDSVKKHFQNDIFSEDPKGFFSLWADLGKRYPVDYIEAFLINNYGYWFPETVYTVVSFGVWTLGPLEDLHYAPILNTGPNVRIKDWFTQAQYTKTPLLPLLFSCGACWWVWLFCGVFCLYHNPHKFIIFMPGFVLWLSILISPVYCEYRYVYGLFTGLPLIMASALGSYGKTQPSAKKYRKKMPEHL